MNKLINSIPRYLRRLFITSEPICTNEIEDKCKQQFKVESELIEGTHKNANEHQSIIHFSFNKAATQYIKSILIRCAIENGMVHAGINEYAFNNAFPFLDHLSAEEMKKYQHIFKPQGYLYSVFGGMVEGISNLEQFHIILAVRDPRDMLVSSYYSQAFSHPAPDVSSNKYQGFMKRRESALSSTIDEYVIIEADNINKTFHGYQQLLGSDHSSVVHVAKYEDMITDFRRWLTALTGTCGLNISDDLWASLIEENRQIKPEHEDFSKHLRKGTAGDYVDKLLPKTIEQLNNKLENMLDVFGYQA